MRKSGTKKIKEAEELFFVKGLQVAGKKVLRKKGLVIKSLT